MEIQMPLGSFGWGDKMGIGMQSIQTFGNLQKHLIFEILKKVIMKSKGQ